MYCSHPLNSLQSGSNAMLSRRSLCLQTANRLELVSRNVTRPRIRKESSGPGKILCCCSPHQTNPPQAFDTGSGDRVRLPTQGESVVRGSGAQETLLQELPKPPADIDYLAELIAVQQSGPKDIGFFGTRNMGFLHQNLIEVLSYAMVLTNNRIYTSGATGTNAAVIRGALRAEKPDLLTVVLPQSLSKQPPESQELLSQVQHVIEMPHNDHLSLAQSSRLCNRDIVARVQQVICFAFHDSNLLLETCNEAKETRKFVTLFYLD
ncbi:hypothetical protein ABBQ32_007337 [Trebouxia sp. C0010 RCD-2024]